MNWIKRIHQSVIVVALVLSPAFSAENMNREPPISSETKKELISILGDALKSKAISRANYERSVAWVNRTPCSKVDRLLKPEFKEQLSSALSKENESKSPRIYSLFSYKGWFIVYTDVGGGDEPYLFFSENPVKGKHSITAWSGAAMIFETDEILKWVKSNSPGIPQSLAECFAWHVTLNRVEPMD